MALTRDQTPKMRGPQETSRSVNLPAVAMKQVQLNHSSCVVLATSILKKGSSFNSSAILHDTVSVRNFLILPQLPSQIVL